ncbi:Dot/Icm secretion system ATPase DotB, partial [bacterium]|nr:Dot/Icm secretion system ATPase DotB [bacterium]
MTPPRITKKDLDTMLLHCVQNQASDITLQTQEPMIAEIYGHLYAITGRPLLSSEVAEMINEIYGPNATTQLSSGVDLDTNYEIRPSRFERIRFRVNATACLVNGADGLQITLRSIPIDPPSLADVQLEEDITKNFAPEQGIIVITGSTGSGKSTLLASIIRSIAEGSGSHRKILTYESPIEFVYDNIEATSCVISQSEIPRHLPTFAAGVRNALRRKPRLILVGEARDEQTIAAVIDAALTGHPVYTTVHSNGVADSVRRMISSFPPEERHGRALDIIESMRMVVWQKLVRTVDGKRIALREYLVFTQEIRDILIDTPVELATAKTRELLELYGQPIAKDAKRKLDQGIIDERTYQLIARK